MEKSTYVFMKYLAWKAYCARHQIDAESFIEFREAYQESMACRKPFYPHFLMVTSDAVLAAEPLLSAMTELGKSIHRHFAIPAQMLKGEK